MEFSALIQQFADRFGIEVPEIVDDAAAFDADGMPFFLMRVANEGESEYLVVAADLGEPPPERLEKLYQALLDAGHNFAEAGGATLAVDPRNGHLYLQKYNWLDRLDVEKAVTGLTRFADMVKLWKGLVAETTAHAPVASDVLSAPTPGAFMQV